MYQPKYHPTCHQLSLTFTAKIVALFDMVFGLFGLVWFVMMLARYDIISLDPFENIADSNSNSTKPIEQLTPLELPESHSLAKHEFATSHKIMNLTLVAFYTVVNIVLFILLMFGIYKKSSGICLIWFYFRCAIFVFKVIIMFMYLLGGRPLFSQIPFIVSMIAHLYGLWVVICYVEELNATHLEEVVKEVEEKRVQEARENCDSYDVPNGIEAVEKRRLEEGRNMMLMIDNNEFTKQA